MQIVVDALAATGLAISAYFAAVFYGWLQPLGGSVAAVCGLDARGCGGVAQTPAARLFGVPNALLGIVFYAGTLLLGDAVLARPALSVVMVAAWAAVALGAYLSYALLFVLRVPCRLCFLAHAINLAIAVMATVAWRS